MSKLRTANLLGALAGAIAERQERHGKAHPNETSSAAAALNVIGFYEGCSNGELAEALGLSHTATVRLVDKLEAGGLVISATGADRRAVALRLTKARDADHICRLCDGDACPEEACPVHIAAERLSAA